MRHSASQCHTDLRGERGKEERRGGEKGRELRKAQLRAHVMAAAAAAICEQFGRLGIEMSQSQSQRKVGFGLGRERTTDG